MLGKNHGSILTIIVFINGCQLKADITFVYIYTMTENEKHEKWEWKGGHC